MTTAQNQIWNATQDKLKNFVFKHIKDKAVTDDIVQDVFLKVHGNVSRLRESDKLVGWIFQITRNTITDYFRGKSKPVDFRDIDWESETNTLNDCVISCLHDMMKDLPEKYREALELSEVKNVSQLEVAKALGISYSGAKSRVQRARQMLKERMDTAYRLKFDTYGNVTMCENRLPCGCD